MLKEAPYQNARGAFLKAPANLPNDAVKANVIGIPFDSSTSFRPGCRFGPKAICEASVMLTDGEHPIYEVDPSQHIRDLGDIITGSSPQETLHAITSHISAGALRTSKPLFSMGGDHLVTLGILRAFQPTFMPDDMGLLIFDAHCDVWADNFGEKYGHGTWVRNVVEEFIVKPKNVMQVGVRSPVDRKTKRWLVDQGAHVFGMDYFHGVEGLVTQIRSFASRFKKLYISIDIDCLDPAFAPGTGTPEVGGFTTRELRKMLHAVGDYPGELLGVDVVEVSPGFDHANITALAAATVLYDMISAHIARST